MFLGFPREMPGAKERRLEHIHQGHIRHGDATEKPRLKNILPELKNLLTNWTYLFNTIGLTFGLLYGASLTVFASKIFRLKFGLNPVKSGYVLSGLIVTGVSCKWIINLFVNFFYTWMVQPCILQTEWNYETNSNNKHNDDKHASLQDWRVRSRNTWRLVGGGGGVVCQSGTNVTRATGGITNTVT